MSLAEQRLEARMYHMRQADYQKLTPESRFALATAQDEARLLGHQEIGAGHLLLGLLTTRDSRAARALRDSGIGLAAVRTVLKGRIPLASKSRTSLGLTADLLSVLELSTAGRDEVTTSGLCCALLSADNAATAVMDALDVDRQTVLARLVDDARVRSQGQRQGSSLVETIKRAIEDAELVAARVDREPDEADVAVALLGDPNSPLGRALAHLGIYREQLEEALADIRRAP